MPDQADPVVPGSQTSSSEPVGTSEQAELMELSAIEPESTQKEMEGCCRVQWEDLRDPDRPSAEWDRLLSDILTSEKVITI